MGKNLKTHNLCDNASTASPLVIPPTSVANHQNVLNVTCPMHPKTTQILLAPSKNVPIAAVTIQPTSQVAPDTNNNFTIPNGQLTNNVK